MPLHSRQSRATVVHPVRIRHHRGRAVRASVSIMAACLSLALVHIAEAAPKYLRLSYVGDTTTAMSITWNTDADAPTEVRYGTASGALGSTASGTSFQANAGLGWVHEVTLSGLQPNTKYYYVAGSATDGYFAENSFTTGPVQQETCGKFRFVFLGDNRPDPTFGGGENWPQILGQAALHQPAFVLNGGDLVIDGDQIDQWHDFLGWTTTVAATVPFMPSMGNHDNGPGEGDGANYNQLFALPRSTGVHGSGTEDYYYFTYGNAIFAALSTEGFKGGSIAFGDQASWLDEVLTNNPRKWKFVFYHKPTYSHEALFSISHAPNEEGQNAAFVAVIDKHHVDAVFTSHNHWYERFHPTACATQGNAGSAEACPVGADNFAAGTVYYVSGGAGAFTIPGMLCGSEPGRAKCAGNHHYIVVDIQDNIAKLDTWSAYPQANEIIDSITITKSPETCTEPPDAGPPDAAPDSAPPPDAAPLDGGSPPDSAAAPDSSTPAPDAAAGSDAAGVDGAAPGPDASEPQAPSASPAASSNGGCGCSVPNAQPPAAAWLALLGLSVAWSRRRGRRSAS